MAKYGAGDRVVLHPNVTGQHVRYEGWIGVVQSIEADTSDHHLSGVARYRVQIDGENSDAVVSVSEKEPERARRDAGTS